MADLLSYLPNELVNEIAATLNLKDWINFTQRTSRELSWIKYTDADHRRGLSLTVSAYNNDHYRGLMWAARVGSICLIMHFLAKGNYDKLDDALCEAAEYGQVGAVHHLMGLGADGMDSALIHAHSNCQHGMIEYLIGAGASDLCGVEMNSALLLACDHGHLNAVQFFAEQVATHLTCPYDEFGRHTASTYHLDSALEHAALGGHLDIITYLVDKVPCKPYMALTYAIANGNPDAVTCVGRSIWCTMYNTISGGGVTSSVMTTYLYPTCLDNSGM